MSNLPRKRPGWEGIGFRSSTWRAGPELMSAVLAARGWENHGMDAVKGKAVTITGDGQAGFGTAGDPILGRLHQFEWDEFITVQDGGYTRMPGVEGSLPSPGDYLVVNGNGAVVASANAPGTARCVSVDTSNNTVMVLLG